MMSRNFLFFLTMMMVGLPAIGLKSLSPVSAAEVRVTVALKSSSDKTVTSTDAEITSDGDIVTVDDVTGDDAIESGSSEAKAKPLSVAPSNARSWTYPPTRPSWVDQSPDMSDALHRWPVVSTPSSTAELSRQALSAQLRGAAETYIETILGETDAASIVSIDDAWIESHLSADHQYEGEVFAGDEVMYESAAQLLFEPADRKWLMNRWQSHQVSERLVNLAILAFLGGTLLFVTTAGMSMVARRAERRVTQSTGGN